MSARWRSRPGFLMTMLSRDAAQKFRERFGDKEFDEK